MNEPDLWRRLLINNLVDASIRFSFFAARFGGVVGQVFRELSEERAKFAGAILREHPDEELAAVLARADGSSTGEDVLAQELDVASNEGEAYAVARVRDCEWGLADFVTGLGDGVLSNALRAQLVAALRTGVARLTESEHRARKQTELSRFSTKSVGVTKRARPAQRIYDVWFGTNRAPVMENGVLKGFSGQTTDDVTLGRCGVIIPRTHKIGVGKPPWWRRVVFGERPLSVQSVASLESGAFWADVRARLVHDGAEADDAIVFLHGYNVSFEDAAVCAAQIGADLNLPGATAFFSWPSQGRMLDYTVDEASIEASEAQITAFLEAFASRSGARRVHVIAHSMGNRGLLRAVDRIAAKASAASGRPFGQIILAAPDVDRRTFSTLCPAYPMVGLRTTLYLSAKDLAVRSSRFVHAAARVGYEPPVTVVPDIDTVSVSKVDLSFLGHGYVASCRAVLTDIHQLIVSELEPCRRAGMTAMSTKDGGYWELAA